MGSVRARDRRAPGPRHADARSPRCSAASPGSPRGRTPTRPRPRSSSRRCRRPTSTFQGLPFLRDYGEATRTIQTAATLVDSPPPPRSTARRMGGGWTRDAVADGVKVEPQGESSVLAVTGKAGAARRPRSSPTPSPRRRSTCGPTRCSARSPAASRASTPSSERLTQAGRQESADLASQIGTLETVRDGNDPTLSFSEQAAVPSAALGAPKWLLVDPRPGRRLRGRQRPGAAARGHRPPDPRRGRAADRPARARSSRGRRSSRDARAAAARSPAAMPPAVREAFRTLRVQLERQPGTHRTIMLTSASSGDGKTTSAVNLALSLVGGGHRVLLIDFDLRKPDLARLLGISPSRRPRGHPDRHAAERAARPAPQLPPLQVVPAASTEGDVALLESLRRRMPDILEEARALADYVVLDTAPLGEVSDALTIGDHVDDIIVVTRPGHTNRANLESVHDLLSSAGLRPTGLLVVGERAGRSRTHYTYGTGANGGKHPLLAPRRPPARARRRAPRRSAKAPENLLHASSSLREAGVALDHAPRTGVQCVPAACSSVSPRAVRRRRRARRRPCRRRRPVRPGRRAERQRRRRRHRRRAVRHARQAHRRARRRPDRLRPREGRGRRLDRGRQRHAHQRAGPARHDPRRGRRRRGGRERHGQRPRPAQARLRVPVAGDPRRRRDAHEQRHHERRRRHLRPARRQGPSLGRQGRPHADRRQPHPRLRHVEQPPARHLRRARRRHAHHRQRDLRQRRPRHPALPRRAAHGDRRQRDRRQRRGRDHQRHRRLLVERHADPPQRPDQPAPARVGRVVVRLRQPGRPRQRRRAQLHLRRQEDRRRGRRRVRRARQRLRGPRLRRPRRQGLPRRRRRPVRRAAHRRPRRRRPPGRAPRPPRSRRPARP